MLVRLWKPGAELVDGMDVNGYEIFVDADSVEYLEPHGKNQTVIYLKRASGEPYRLCVVDGAAFKIAEKIDWVRAELQVRTTLVKEVRTKEG